MKVIALSVLLMAVVSSGFSAPTFMDSHCLDEWKMSVSLATDICYPSSRGPAALPDVGFRIGLPGGYDVGARAFIAGGILDIKHYFTVNPRFYTTWDLDIAFSSTLQASFSGALIIDLIITDFLNSYISMRWRIPANPDIDSIVYPVSGTQFTPRVGVGIFRNGPYNIIVEGGLVLTGYSPNFGYNYGAMFTWKI